MEPQSLRSLIESYAAAWARKDRAGWLATFAPDATQEDPVGEGVRRGHSAIGEFWDRAMEGRDSLEIRPRAIHVAGSEGAMEWRITARRDDEWTTFDGVDVFTFTDGPLIASVRAYWDRTTFRVSRADHSPAEQDRTCRVSVIGAPGTGKTTFAARVAGITEARHVELDALWWGPDWTAVDVAEFQRRVRDVVAGQSWVIDGFYLDEAARPLIWPRADSIVWLDLPRRIAAVRALRRSAIHVLRRTRLWGGANRQTAHVLSPRAVARFVRGWPTYPSRIQEALQTEALTGKTIVRLRNDRAKKIWLADLAAEYERGV